MRKVMAIAVAISIFCLASLSAQAASFLDLVKDGTPQAVQAAIDKGADLKAVDPKGLTPLMLAASWNPDPAVIGVLLKAGSVIGARELAFGRTVLMLASEYNRPDVVSALLKAGGDPEARDQYGETALMYAAAENPDPAVITTLVRGGAIVRDRGGTDTTPSIVWAAESNKPEVVSELLRLGADPNDGSTFGTALHYAAGSNPNPGAIIVLLKAGADPRHTNWDNKIPYFYAKDRPELQGTDALWMLEEASK